MGKGVRRCLLKVVIPVLCMQPASDPKPFVVAFSGNILSLSRLKNKDAVRKRTSKSTCQPWVLRLAGSSWHYPLFISLIRPRTCKSDDRGLRKVSVWTADANVPMFTMNYDKVSSEAMSKLTTWTSFRMPGIVAKYRWFRLSPSPTPVGWATALTANADE